MEWQAEQDRHCKGCGQPLDESMDEENTFEYRAEAWQCHGCRAMHRAAVKMTGGGKENPIAGMRFVLHHTNGDG